MARQTSKIVSGRPVSAQKPDHALVFVTAAQKLSVGKGI